MGVADTILSYAKVGYWGVILIISLALIGAAIYFMIRLIQYNKTVIVREITGTKRLIVVDKARETKARDGTLWWKLRKRRHRFPKPPADALDLTKRGKQWYECYYTDQGSYIAVKDVGMSSDDLKAVESFKPFTADQRRAYILELQQALSRRTKTLSEIVAMTAPYMAIIIIFVMFLLFFGDVVEPINEMAGTAQAMSNDLKEAMRMLQEVVQSKQTIGETPPVVPPE